MLFVAVCNVVILASTKNQILAPEKGSPQGYDVALVLGTSKWTRRGTQNLFFKGRVQASHALYRHGIVKHLLLSGDNSVKEYNEPLELKKALEEKGVAPSDMTMDFAGFRTLDSVIRSKKIFGQDSVIVVTQSFHLPRALFIARMNGIQAKGYEASGPIVGKVLFREVLARTAAVVDVLVNRQPKFLGEQEHIRVN